MTAKREEFLDALLQWLGLERTEVGGRYSDKMIKYFNNFNWVYEETQLKFKKAGVETITLYRCITGEEDSNQLLSFSTRFVDCRDYAINIRKSKKGILEVEVPVSACFFNMDFLLDYFDVEDWEDVLPACPGREVIVDTNRMPQFYKATYYNSGYAISKITDMPESISSEILSKSRD